MVVRFAAFGRLILCALLIALAAPAPGMAQTAEPSGQAALDALKTALEQVEAALGREDIGADALGELRRTLTDRADAIRARVDEIQPQAGDLEARLKQLGPPPAKDAPPESPETAAEREQLTQNFADADGMLKQARVLAVRADQLSDRLAEKRHALYARELFARSASALDPALWSEAIRALPRELRTADALFQFWKASRIQAASSARLFAAALLLLGIVLTSVAVTRWWLPRFRIASVAETQSAKAAAAFWVFVWLGVRAPLALYGAIAVLGAFGLLTERVEQILQGLLAGVAAAAFARAAARALFAPEEPARRLVGLDDETARCLHDHLVWSARALAVAVFLQVAHKTLFAPLAVTVATNTLFATFIAAFLLHLVLRLGRLRHTHGEAFVAIPGVHPLALALAVLIGLALIAGYTGFAAFIALRVVVAATVFGALYLLIAITKAVFASLSEDTRRGRMLAAHLGLTPRTVGLAAALLSATVRLTLIVVSCLLIIGPWEVSTADLFDTVRNVPFGFKVGEINVSLRAVLSALVMLVALLAISRVVQRWLETEFLPRTTLEPSLRISVATICGYVGVITAITLAMAALGIDLQKIALVAGALSVGIGFGLQSIVSNFVSGLILLAERPIRVGDSIVVKGEEGWVRRVRVRATEIETYDRASVIIPNSEFITGVVKNWTHANTNGRIVIKIGVSYDSDPEQVRDLLLELAREHPQVLQAPPPSVFFMAFGNSALDFELRCIVGNVENGLRVKSELHYAILKKFRGAGIEIPYPQTEVRLRSESGTRLAAPNAGEPRSCEAG